jgi:leucyl aminopeptidase
MEFNVRTTAPAKTRTGCVVVGVHEGRRLSESAAALNEACAGALVKILADGDLGDDLGATLLTRSFDGISATRILLVRCGTAKDLTPARFRSISRSACQAIAPTGTGDALICLGELAVGEETARWKARTVADAAGDAVYRFSETKSKPAPAPTWNKTSIAANGSRDAKQAEHGAQEGQALVGGKKLAKDLGNLPGNYCTPTYLAQQATYLAKGRRKLRTRVLDEAQMRELGMGSLLSVSAGSRQEAKLIVMEYKGGNADRRPVVLVGKGVTFDTGGVSLKPGAGMDEMKFDMCGAASVFGTIEAAVTLDLPINVVGIIPATENMPDGNATKPGDVVTSMSGQTIEILNTDAEGRLILCDALTYAERFDPDVVIDIATLTGACVVALGHHPSGLFTNYDGLSKDLCKSGETSGDRVWPMPVWDEYQAQIKSNFADMANVGGRDGGAITAACFLSRFTKDYRWAHLDIAGTAWHSGARKGSTGRPVALLTQYLIDHSGPAAQRKKRS